MVRDRDHARITARTRAQAQTLLVRWHAAEQARRNLEAVVQCTALLDPSAPWTQCRLIQGHDEQTPPTPHRTGPGGVQWT